MKAQTVDVKESAGRILCCTIFRPGGRKLLAKGHVLNEDDVRLLETEGLGQVWVTELEEGEVGEDDAVSQAAAEMGCGCLEIRLAAGGRANLFATEDCCVLVDDELLKQINCVSSLVIATSLNFSFARAGQRIATVKSAPFAVAQSQLEAIINVLKERGPILQARPVRGPSVGVLYSDPVQGERARQLFESIMRQRLERFAVVPTFALSTIEEEDSVARSLNHLLRAKTHSGTGSIHHGASGARRRYRPRDDPHRLPPGAVSGAGGTWQFITPGLQRGNTDRLSSGLFPVRQAERRRLGFAAHAGALPGVGLGSRLFRPWRPLGLEPSSFL